MRLLKDQLILKETSNMALEIQLISIIPDLIAVSKQFVRAHMIQ